MTSQMRAVCSCCGKEANLPQEVEEKFGFRRISGNQRKPQPYCRRCRSAGCGRKRKNCE
ncbi:hypothetical protein JCM16358_04550 [Halanaerocella petrolearia]